MARCGAFEISSSSCERWEGSASFSEHLFEGASEEFQMNDERRFRHPPGRRERQSHLAVRIPEDLQACDPGLGVEVVFGAIMHECFCAETGTDDDDLRPEKRRRVVGIAKLCA